MYVKFLYDKQPRCYGPYQKLLVYPDGSIEAPGSLRVYQHPIYKSWVCQVSDKDYYFDPGTLSICDEPV